MSRARDEGICNFFLWTTEELIEAYIAERSRVDTEKREETQELIKAELKRRFNRNK